LIVYTLTLRERTAFLARLVIGCVIEQDEGEGGFKPDW